MKNINSRQNSQITAVAALGTQKARAQQGRFIAEGFRCCSALINSSIKLSQLYVVQEALDDAQKMVNSDKITLVAPEVMEKISQSSTPSGILGVFCIPPQPEALHPGLVLTGISDPGNMGTLIRTCAALNIRSMVIIGGADLWSPKVVQASAGTIGALDIFQWSWEDLIEHKGDLPLYALVVKDGVKPTSAHNNGLLIVGNEAHGISPESLAQCDELLTIPMPGSAESLNAAIAGSLALYLVFS